jgi:acyl dehydratase
MTIDSVKVLGAPLTSARYSWEPDDVILYHLALGAATKSDDLKYVYEEGLEVLPTFGVLPATAVAKSLDKVPGMGVDLRGRLHGEHEIELVAPLPVAATVTTKGRISALYDKGNAAVAVLETTTSDSAGNPLVVNRFSMFLRGAGGFGGTQSVPPPPQRPTTPADYVATCPTTRQQAMLYRLTGDKNPIHAALASAKAAGFPRPILHGLCTFGMVLKSSIDTVLSGEVAAVTRFRARFAGVVFPGETIQVSTWRDGLEIHVEASTLERGKVVLTNGVITTT